MIVCATATSLLALQGTAGAKGHIEYGVHADGLLAAEPDVVGTAACANTKYRLHGWAVPVTSDQRYERYEVNTFDFPGHLDAEEVLADIESGLVGWNTQANDCLREDSSNMLFHQGGTFSSSGVPGLCQDPKVSDGINEIAFIGHEDMPIAAAGAMCWKTETNSAGLKKLLEWDIVLSLDPGRLLVPYEELWWGTENEPSDLDIWNIVAHEAGHVTGVAHACEDLTSCADQGGTQDDACSLVNSVHKYLTMFGCTWPGNISWRTLGLGDMLGLEYIVPRRPTG